MRLSRFSKTRATGTLRKNYFLVKPEPGSEKPQMNADKKSFNGISFGGAMATFWGRIKSAPRSPVRQLRLSAFICG